jgi:hypothetical protein
MDYTVNIEVAGVAGVPAAPFPCRSASGESRSSEID